jgi:hypothetical protein
MDLAGTPTQQSTTSLDEYFLSGLYVCMDTILPTTNNILQIIVFVNTIKHYYHYQYNFSLLFSICISRLRLANEGLPVYRPHVSVKFYNG